MRLPTYGPGMDAQSGIDRVFVPIAVGQALAALETLRLKDEFGDDGLLRGLSALQHKPGTLRHKVARLLDSRHTPKVLAAVNLAAATTLGFARGRRRTQVAMSALIALNHQLNELRTPYGRDGADQMSAVIAQYRVLTALVGRPEKADDLFLRAVNFQAALSYVASGTSKATGSSWVLGDALSEILTTAAYGQAPLARAIRDKPALLRALSHGTILWETLFPLVYLLPRDAARTALHGVKAFHLGVAAVMELPRFVWGFFASHGAIEYVIDQRGSGSSIEKQVVTAATAATLVSGLYAKNNRRTALLRRSSEKGTMQLDDGTGTVEYVIDSPEGAGGDLPTIVLECGLGQSLEAWDWVTKELSKRYTIIRYHRAGYGLTTSRRAPNDLLTSILDAHDIHGEIAIVTHSIGFLAAVSHMRDPALSTRVKGLVVLDGTDPDLLDAERSDRKRSAQFVQTQVHTLIASAIGMYEWAPNVIVRQSKYVPEIQYAHVQFAFSPNNVLNALREHRTLPTDSAIEAAKEAPNLLVVASAENLAQQTTLARKLGAKLASLETSNHRTMISAHEHAEKVADLVKEVVG